VASRENRDVRRSEGGKRLPKGIALQKEKNNYPYVRVVDFADGKIQISPVYHVNNTLPEYIIKLC
jgi:hypothetical protein